jgi:hypothetical protein
MAMKLTMGMLTAAIVVIGHASDADAAKAKLKPNGKYAFTITETCEAKFGYAVSNYVTEVDLNTSVDPPTLGTVSASAMKTVNSTGNGHIGAGVGYIDFKASSNTEGTFDMSVTDISGGALRIVRGEAGSGPPGINVGKNKLSFHGTYKSSSSAMTLTLPDNSTMDFTAVYGELDSAGVPSSVHLVRKKLGTETGNCVQAITATK